MIISFLFLISLSIYLLMSYVHLSHSKYSFNSDMWHSLPHTPQVHVSFFFLVERVLAAGLLVSFLSLSPTVPISSSMALTLSGIEK